MKQNGSKKIGYVNKTIQSGITSMNGKELEIINVTITYDMEANKQKENLNAYDNKGKEKTSIMSENKEKACDGYVSMYECRKHLFNSKYESACEAQETTTSNMKEILDMCKYEIE